MKKILTLIVIIFFAQMVYADTTGVKSKNLPQGIFKKKSNGVIVQYNKNGKKTGIYKKINGKYVKVK